jgi:hypothetical protein
MGDSIFGNDQFTLDYLTSIRQNTADSEKSVSRSLFLLLILAAVFILISYGNTTKLGRLNLVVLSLMGN